MEHLKKFLEKRRDSSTLRRLSPVESRSPGRIVQDGDELVDFSSNDYIGLSNHPRLVAAAMDAIGRYGVGAGASRLMTGDLQLHHDLEAKVASFKGKERALVFNSGYQANVGIISALVGRRDAVFADRLCHASQLDGVALSGAKLFRFRHNDLDHLQELLQKGRSGFDHVLILTESVFSMDGDLAPLRALVDLKDSYDSQLMVDEAHATGVFGDCGRGRVHGEGLTSQVDLVMGTFSKALGGFGAYVAASNTVIDYLINSARSFIYSTALPPSVIASNLAALEVCESEPHRGRELLALSHSFRQVITGLGWETAGESQIVPVMIGDSCSAIRLADEMRKRGLRVLPIRPPTVPEGTARLRLSVCYSHSEEDLTAAVRAFSELR